jgi:hypothetical protein
LRPAVEQQAVSRAIHTLARDRAPDGALPLDKELPGVQSS